MRRRTFQNQSFTPQLAEGVSMFKIFKDFFLKARSTPPRGAIATQKINLKSYYSDKPSIIWFGHSSYLIHYKGMNILVDPVLSGSASPFSFYIKAFEGTDIYTPEEMPDIDILILTHNHYDHLDLRTLKKLRDKTKLLFMPLGVSRDLKNLNIDRRRINEMDWWQQITVNEQVTLTATPARHFSGRGLRRNTSLWASFVLRLDHYRIFIGSDSGYDTHFKDIGSGFGPFDLAILECGQYNTAWPFIHSEPEQLITEGADLKARVIMPVHWGKFALAFHPWDEPIKRFVIAAEKSGTAYTTPMIGEPVVIEEYLPASRWWE